MSMLLKQKSTKEATFEPVMSVSSMCLTCFAFTITAYNYFAGLHKTTYSYSQLAPQLATYYSQLPSVAIFAHPRAAVLVSSPDHGHCYVKVVMGMVL